MQFFENLLLAAVAFLPLGSVVAAPIDNAFSNLDQKNAGDVIAGSYIVVLHPNISTQAFSNHREWATRLHAKHNAKRDTQNKGLGHLYDFGSLKGYSGTFDTETIREISARAEVDYVEPDRVIKLESLTSERDAPSWGLGRISSRSRGNPTYSYDETAGDGVTAYVIDTGIMTSHNEFGGRATMGANFIDNINTDGHGHGTHVAGTIGGLNYGVAKRVKLVAVKVLNSSGNGATSGVIAGIQWAARRAAGQKAVANMSLGGPYSEAMNSAVGSAINSGLTFAVAAGNSNTDASGTSPASQGLAITVGATDSNDNRASYSNYGAVLDIFAPGSNIVSAGIASDDASKTLSGTSMASPHVAGVTAYLLSLENLSSPAAVAKRLADLASNGYVSNAGGGSPNLLLYNGCGQ